MVRESEGFEFNVKALKAFLGYPIPTRGQIMPTKLLFIPPLYLYTFLQPSSPKESEGFEFDVKALKAYLGEDNT